MSVRRPDPRQTSFSFFLPPASVEPTLVQADDFDHRQRLEIARVLDDVAKRPVEPMDREAVAAAMSSLLGRRVSKAQLDQWSAPSQGDRRIHVDALRALGLATGDWRALHHLVEACGFRALTPQEAVCAEYGALQAVRRHIDQRARALTGDMEGLVSGLMSKMKREVV